MKPLLAALLVAALPAAVAFADGPKDLLGEWSGSCDAWGTPATCMLGWREGLHPDHMEVAYTILPSEGAPLFSGQGVYSVSGTTISGYWSDSGGAIHPLSAQWKDTALTTHWGEAGGTLGRSRYELTESGLRVTDWILSEQGWQQFMQADYARAD